MRSYLVRTLSFIVFWGTVLTLALIQIPADANPGQSLNQWVSEQPGVLETRQGVEIGEAQIFLIRLRDKPLASYRGEILGLEATNPSAAWRTQAGREKPGQPGVSRLSSG